MYDGRGISAFIETLIFTIEQGEVPFSSCKFVPMKIKTYFFLAVFLIACTKDDSPNNPDPVDTRSFYMGFTAFPYDNSIEALTETYQNVTQYGDIFLNHLDQGVPWDEALNDLPFPSEVQGTLEATKNGLQPGTKIFLTATPTDQNRNQLARYWNNNGSHQPLPSFWENKAFNDPDVIAAYIKYCRRIIDEVQPDYFAYGIETNASFRNTDATFDQFLALADTVYTTLKSEYPELIIFLTLQDQSFVNTREELLVTSSRLLEHSDYIAISTYPFLYYLDTQRDANPELFEDNWLSDFRNLNTEKPMAISETGFCAEDLIIPNLAINVQGRADWQEAYMTKLFHMGNELDLEFLTWFVYRDYDLLYEKTTNPPDILKVWRDNGLIDGEGVKRPSHQVWEDWLARTRD